MKRYRNTPLNTDANFADSEKLILKKKKRDLDDEVIVNEDDFDEEVSVSEDE